jgi:hypothetical protein
MKRDILEKPFEPGQIKQRVGNFGNVLDYIEGHSVITRLNEAFDGSWCFEIIEFRILEDKDEVLVLGKLTVDKDVVKYQFGSSKITRAKDTGEAVSLGDDLKSAGTDCLKKCATMLGVGLYLYNGDKSLHAPNGENGNPKSESPQAPGTKGGDGGKPTNGGRNHSDQGEGRLTSKQFKFIARLANEKGLTRKELNERCIKTFGAASDYLSRAQASTLIDELMGQ